MMMMMMMMIMIMMLVVVVLVVVMVTYNQPTILKFSLLTPSPKMFLYSDYNNLCNHRNATNQNVSKEQKQWLCTCAIHIRPLRFVRTHYGPMRPHPCYQLSCSAFQYAVQGGSNLSLWVKFYSMTTEV